MTAEVAILNKNGVALAADSAVTIGDSKIFNTVNKLFALSKHEPVGMMAYSSADVLGVPIETVIKSFRRELGTESLSALQDYYTRFDDYLRNDDKLFNSEDRLNALGLLVKDAIVSISNRTYKVLGENTGGWGHPTSDEAADAVKSVVSQISSEISKRKTVAVEDKAKSRKSILEVVSGTLKLGIEDLRERFPLDRTTEAKIRKLIIDHYFREYSFRKETGIVVAGFGHNDKFPHLKSCHFHVSACGVHKVVQTASADITSGMTGSIVPFAQADVMSIFIEGIDRRRYSNYLSKYIRSYFTEKYDSICAASSSDDPLAKQLMEVGSEFARAIPEEINSISQEAFVRPLMGIVSTMPKEELALLAESFINLTALKRRASQNAETVGGPTDVAVISKGDGFIWIKRKHYFDPKLNPAFIASYLETKK